MHRSYFYNMSFYEKYNYDFLQELGQNKMECFGKVELYLYEQKPCIYDHSEERDIWLTSSKPIIFWTIMGLDRFLDEERDCVPLEESFDICIEAGQVLRYIQKLFAVAICNQWDEAEIQRQLELGIEPIQLKNIRVLYNAIHCCNPMPKVDDNFDLDKFESFLLSAEPTSIL
jgi:hypothetical protein